jgi:hypothetical protein
VRAEGGAARARDAREQGVGRPQPGEEEGRGRERERREGGNSPPGIQISVISTPNPRAPRGEREVEEGEGVTAREKSNESNGSREGGARRGWAGAPGARGPDRVGPGRAEPGWARSHRGSKPATCLTIKRN